MVYDLKKSVWDAWNACKTIQEYAAGYTWETYQADRIRRNAIERQFEILGEAFKRIDDAEPSFRECFDDVGVAIGMRNRLIHGYDRVNDVMVWDVVTENIPNLTTRLAAWLQENP